MEFKKQYKQIQEEFVSNHTGSAPEEIFFAILPCIFGILLSTTTLNILPRSINKNIKVLIEFTSVIIPSVLSCTIWSENIIPLCLTMVSISILAMTLSRKGCKSEPINKHIPLITNFRAITNILSCICILAVDFQIFPRKFAKTETFGYSLMDTGVGLFILSNALVVSKGSSWIKSLKDSTFLLILGLGRFLFVEYSGYQKHVTEYGVHWNFFITLAFIRLFATAINTKRSLLSGLLILSMHEYILSTNGIKEWVLSDYSRDTFVSANREGLVSLPGYIGLYLIGIEIGKLINSNKSIRLFFKLLLLLSLSSIATPFLDHRYGISRRLADLGYCIWIVALGTGGLTVLVSIDSVCKRLEIIEAINYNGLGFFLFCNITTGIVNMCIHTLYVDPWTSIFILISYMALNIFIILSLHRYQIQIKL